MRIDDQRGCKDSLEIRLVPARKGPARVGRFELRGGHRLGRSRRVFVGAPIEAAQLVIEEAVKGDDHTPCARSHGLCQCQPTTLQHLVQFNGSVQPLLPLSKLSSTVVWQMLHRSAPLQSSSLLLHWISAAPGYTALSLSLQSPSSVLHPDQA